MERPLKDVRPLGPFAQSESFNDRLLGGSSTQEMVDLTGQTILVEIVMPTGSSMGDIERTLENIVEDPLDEFVSLRELGSLAGDKEVAEQPMEVLAVYYDVIGADPEVTVGQVEDFIQQELSGVTRISSADIYTP